MIVFLLRDASLNFTQKERKKTIALSVFFLLVFSVELLCSSFRGSTLHLESPPSSSSLSIAGRLQSLQPPRQLHNLKRKHENEEVCMRSGADWSMCEMCARQS